MTTSESPLRPVHPGSLRTKIMLVVMAATCAALLLSATALLLYEVRVYRDGWVSDLGSQADLVAQSVAPTLAFDDPKAAREALAVLQQRPQIRAAAVYRANGELFASYRDGSAAARPLPARAGASGPHFEGEELELSHQIRQNGELLGTLHLRAEHNVTSRILDYLVILALASLGGLAVAALIFRQLHPAITRPILAMADVSRRVIEDKNYDLRVTERSDDEVGILVTAFNNMLRDLSAEMRERHSAESALQEADRKKDEFLAMLAHELRNPLAPLTTSLAILARADDNAALRRATHAIMERQLAQMVRLIDDLLEVSRITRGKLELRRAIIEVSATARVALEAAEPMLGAKRHVVSAEWAAGPLWVDADAARLTQVIVNLLHNAARYTPAGGQVRLRTEARGDAVAVVVEDNGIGIDAAQQQSIFAMFEQVDKSIGRGAAGLGIGLTIARQLVEMHGGSLDVQSAGLGQGATFTVRLPRAVAPVAAATPPAVAAPAGAGPAMRVLIADDNVDFATGFAHLLGLEGHAVQVVHDGLAALAAIDATAFDAAFLDIGMPGMNGLDLAARLRAAPASRPLLLVAVTGWGQDSDKLRVREAGFDHHLTKPLDVNDAVRLLQAAAEASFRVSPDGLPESAPVP